MTTALHDPHIQGAPTIDAADEALRVAELLSPGADQRDRTGVIPTDIFDELGAAGLTTALVPTEFGGGGATHAEMGRMLRTLGSADASVAVTLSMHCHLLAAQVWRHKHGMDASAVFEKVTNGAFLVSTGASDWLGSTGSAVKVDGGYIVTATKTPASGCEVGTVLVTSIRWDDGPDGPQLIHCSIPFAATGVDIERTWDTAGLRATGSHTVRLTDVFVPDGAVSLIRPADIWHPIWNVVLGAAMPLIMAAYLGVADAAVAEAIAAVDGRGDAHLDHLVGEMVNAHQAAVDVVDAMFAASDDLGFANTDAHSGRTLTRKTVACTALLDTVRLATEVVGGRSFSRGHLLERLRRDIQGCVYHPLPRATQLPFSGRVARGLDPIG